MTCVYFGKISEHSDSLFMIKADENAPADEYYKSVTCEIGIPPYQIQRLEVLDVWRQRDGGTTTIIVVDSLGEYNELGKEKISFFYFPFPHNKEIKPDTVNTFREKPIILLPCPDRAQ